jgi:hypothetical protein
MVFPLYWYMELLTIGNKQAETEKSENLFLYIDLPRFDFPVIFSEPVGCELCHNKLFLI